MRFVARAFATLIVVLATNYFVFWVPFSLIPVEWPAWVPPVGSLLAAIAAGRYVWTRSAGLSGGLAGAAIMGAFVTGAIGFSAGFFGPIVFAPGANQGPLLGIFITGPLGFLLGGMGGAAYWFARGRSTTGREAA